jgi:hypothetical protein
MNASTGQRSLIVLEVLASVLLAACGSAYPSRTFSGTLDTYNARTAPVPRVGPHGSCAASGISDIPATGGVPVTVRDAVGKVLGSATLGKGAYRVPPHSVQGGYAQTPSCRFAFRFTKIPRASSYLFSVARHREVASVSFSEMREHRWTVALSLGAVVGGR